MAKQALAALESALRVRKLDRTLTTALPPLQHTDPASVSATDLSRLDACLQGGVPRGQVSEIAGARSSGVMTLLLQLVAAATRRGEIAAIVDTLDRLDIASVVAAGVDLDRLLWIRGDATTALPERAIERALKALNLVLQAGGFGVVALDLSDLPPRALNSIPHATWLRLQRAIEGTDTSCLLLTTQPLARSAGGLTLSLTGRTRWTGTSDRSRLVDGLDLAVRVVSPRRRVDGQAHLAAVSADHGTPRHRGTENSHGFSSVSQRLGPRLSLGASRAESRDGVPSL